MTKSFHLYLIPSRSAARHYIPKESSTTLRLEMLHAFSSSGLCCSLCATSYPKLPHLVIQASTTSPYSIRSLSALRPTTGLRCSTLMAAGPLHRPASTWPSQCGIHWLPNRGIIPPMHHECFQPSEFQVLQPHSAPISASLHSILLWCALL